MNRSQFLIVALSLTLVPCAALLAGCPEETKADAVDSGADVTAMTTKAATTAVSSATAIAIDASTPVPSTSSAMSASPASDAGPATDAGKDGGKAATKK